MPRYLVQRDYASVAGRFRAGEVIELGEEMAAWVNRDSPGCLVPVTRAEEKPPADRMMRGKEKRGWQRT